MKFDSIEIVGIGLMIAVLYCIVVCVVVFRRKPDAEQRVGKPKSGFKWIAPGQIWTGQAVNIDGTPMMGNTDIYGNPYGVTSAE